MIKMPMDKEVFFAIIGLMALFVLKRLGIA